MRAKNNLSKTHILWGTLAWIVGLALVFIIWTILSATVYKNNGVLPNVGKCFVAFGKILSSNQNWKAMAIAWSQSLACLLGAFILSTGFAILSRYSKIVYYIMIPFVTLARALPTAVLLVLIAVFLLPVPALVPIVVAFFVIFPMLYEGINNAIDNIDHKQIEMANVFNVSKWNQFWNIYVPVATPYLFSSLVAGFGLTFKIAIASQFVQTVVTSISPDYPSIGVILSDALKNKQYDLVMGWGMIAIVLSLVMELIIKEIGRLSMPSKYQDRKILINFFTRGKYHA